MGRDCAWWWWWAAACVDCGRQREKVPKLWRMCTVVVAGEAGGWVPINVGEAGPNGAAGRGSSARLGTNPMVASGSRIPKRPAKGSVKVLSRTRAVATFRPHELLSAECYQTACPSRTRSDLFLFLVFFYSVHLNLGLGFRRNLTIAPFLQLPLLFPSRPNSIPLSPAPGHNVGDVDFVGLVAGHACMGCGSGRRG